MRIARTYTCPFWSWDRKMTNYCHAAKLDFRTPHARTAFLDAFCSSFDGGWHRCPMELSLEADWEAENG